ncbi:hypothetical protein F5051DRAFT_433709 [Lentinula edodes]|nr:hypothetical protein F5051DRAFT_433709 [Lentinula edodes]
MQLLSPSTKLYFTLWMGALFLVPTMAVPTGSPPPNSELMAGGLSASDPDLPGHSTGADGNTYDQVLDALDANTGLNPVIEAKLWIHPDIFKGDAHYRNAMSSAVEYMMIPIRSTILEEIKTKVKKNNPSLKFASSTLVPIYHFMEKKDFTNLGDFEISFSGATTHDRTHFRYWWFAMPGSGDPSYFGHIDLKCLVPTRKGLFTFKKELVTGKISRGYPEQNEEVLVSLKDGKWAKFFLKCIMAREKIYFAKDSSHVCIDIYPPGDIVVSAPVLVGLNKYVEVRGQL